MQSDFVCLGLEFLGECSYNPSDPISYFTLGNLVSVIAILLAISQLTKPVIEFRIRSNNLNLKTLNCLVLIAIISIFIATLLPFIPGKAMPLLGYPVFWEFLSAVLFVVLAIYVISTITKPAQFTKKNANQFLNATVLYIAKGGEERLNELAKEILPSISSIIQEANNFDVYEAITAKKNNKIYEVAETTKIANTILDIWSDKLFCVSIVCRSPATAIEIISDLSKNPNSGVGRALSQEIINQSIENNNSLLNREESYSGLGFFKNFMYQCFGNWRFVDSTYRPLQSWVHHKNKLTQGKVKKYCECVNTAFRSYLKSKDYYQDLSSLHAAMDTMEMLAMDQVKNIKNIPKHEIYNSENQKILTELSHGYESIIETILKQDNYPDYEFDEDSYNYSKDLSIFGVAAKGIYSYFECLAIAKGHDDLIRHHAIVIWLNIFSVSSSEPSRNKEEIGKRLLFHIRKKVSQNLDHEQKYYPAITKLLLSLNGIAESEHSDGSLGSVFHLQILETIKVKFPLLYQSDQEFALNMLPESIIYKPGSNKLIHKRFHGNTSELILLGNRIKPLFHYFFGGFKN